MSSYKHTIHDKATKVTRVAYTYDEQLPTLADTEFIISSDNSPAGWAVPPPEPALAAAQTTTPRAGWAESAALATAPVVRDSGYVTKDSGQRQEFATGSVRDSREGKGRFELISPFALARIAGVYERGAAKYASRNWEKGQPYSRFLDSALRHLNRFAMGWTDEDHVSQAAWNILAILHFQELGRTDLDDMPHYQAGPKE